MSAVFATWAAACFVTGRPFQAAHNAMLCASTRVRHSKGCIQKIGISKELLRGRLLTTRAYQRPAKHLSTSTNLAKAAPLSKGSIKVFLGDGQVVESTLFGRLV